jgi:hypothetical protein
MAKAELAKPSRSASNPDGRSFDCGSKVVFRRAPAMQAGTLTVA